MEVFKEYRFEAAHWLPGVPEGHPCRRTHGHSYRIVIRLNGQVGAMTGWVVDFAVIDSAFLPLHEQLDHRLLNEIDGLENPTCEVLAHWLWSRLAPALAGLHELEVSETADSGCRMTKADLA